MSACGCMIRSWRMKPYSAPVAGGAAIGPAPCCPARRCDRAGLTIVEPAGSPGSAGGSPSRMSGEESDPWLDRHRPDQCLGSRMSAGAAAGLAAGPRALHGNLRPRPAERANPPPPGLKLLDVQLMPIGAIKAYSHRSNILQTVYYNSRERRWKLGPDEGRKMRTGGRRKHVASGLVRAWRRSDCKRPHRVHRGGAKD